MAIAWGMGVGETGGGGGGGGVLMRELVRRGWVLMRM